MMKNSRSWFPFVFFFIILTVLFFTGKNWLAKNNVSHEVLIGGNLVLFVATLFSFLVFQRSLHSSNPQASVRGMMGSFIIKFFICLVAVFIYIFAAKENVNKPALVICMVLYIIYSAMEVMALQKLIKQKKNA